MRIAVLFLCFASAASAQSPLFPDGTAEAIAAPHWRFGASAGFADGVGTAAGSFSAERSVTGRLAIGGRAAIYAGPGFQDDGASFEGASLEALVSVGTRDRVLDLRALAGAGAALLSYDPGFCIESSGSCPEPEVSDLSLSPLVFVGAGLDLYVTASLGLGVEVRLAPTVDEINLSAAEIGLRFRIAR